MLYGFGRLIFATYLKIFFRFHVHGRENIPVRRPFIICANHIKWLDPVSVAVAVPASIQIHFMAKKELFSNFLFTYILNKVGAFPVNRQDADYAAFRRAFQLLKDGKVLGLFPEGTRSNDGKLQKAYGGAALIAVRSGAPILPMAILGPYQLCKPVHVYIGSPFVLPPLIYEQKEDKKMMLEEMSREIMNNIRNLLPNQGIADSGEKEMSGERSI
ncbi:MAG: lysophospholipid acyltransferase family protein [Bacillota bacterium]|nr:lysophospholipid acyltransferase family protein [Bacillota bacterium]